MTVNTITLNETQLRWANSPARNGRRVFEIGNSNRFEFGAENCTISAASPFARKRAWVIFWIEADLAALKSLEIGGSVEITKISTHPRHPNRRVAVTRIA